MDIPGVTLRRLLASVGEQFLELRAGSMDVRVRGVAILDPGDEPMACPGELVLVIGARGREALRVAERAGAPAVAVRPAGEDLSAAARDAGVALLTVPGQVRWDQLQALIRQVLDDAALAAAADLGHGDLFALAETVATLTAGSVSIEDAANRVVAYSRSDDDIDELRRRTILGWEGPGEYLALLREWGVYQRLRSAEEVVHVEQRLELGIRRRLAIGIRAGTQHLGAIWVQEGRRPFADQAESAVLGAARIAAVHLLRRRGSPGLRSGEDLIEGLLEGRTSADLVAGQFGLDPAASAIVLVFAVREIEPDRPAHELHRLELSTVVSVYVTSYRRGALVGTIGPRVYAVLPEVARRRAEPALITLARQVVGVLARAGVRAQAGIGSVVSVLGDVVVSRSEADRVLEAMARTPERDVATISDLRSEVLLGETLALLDARPDLRDPAVEALVAHDAGHGTELVTSLLAYLDALGDVRAAATRLHIHPNTLRHRIRRATALGGIDLDDPRARLFCHLQILLARRS
ncbi:MAG TPA: helix-turn-helix domain-containing protein [Amycolatopsis sp.]|uniref:PucR family transcriptional regulator n=1 Tax=Amycolatopsis sp. TaxID=37632 RepID=UPI002B45C3AB|nr:helix-turn-helix domain-containing protein [Amycolatopsis sp.]HKS50032.1 helix-turn-helix domain-containing protein [Amycolatopsis sp.]